MHRNVSRVRFVHVGAWILAAASLWLLVVRPVSLSYRRSNVKRTMALIRTWSERIERGSGSLGPATEGNQFARATALRRIVRVSTDRRDAWGTPLAMHVTPNGFEIRSAGSDRRFDRRVQGGETPSPDADIVWIRDYFAQYPVEGGIVTVDGTPPPRQLFDPVVTNCASCHRGEVADRLE
jgi:hypothetical protein